MLLTSLSLSTLEGGQRLCAVKDRPAGSTEIRKETGKPLSRNHESSYAYYRKHKTLNGCPHLPPEELEKLKADMASSWHLEDKPFATWALSNNSAEIRRERPYQILFTAKRNRFCGLGI